MKKKLLIISLFAILGILLAFGAYRIDILINGERLPISNEIPQMIEVFPPIGSEKSHTVLKIESDEEEIREIVSLFREIRYKTCEQSGHETDSYALYFRYAHYGISLRLFPDAVAIWGDENLLYTVTDAELLQRKAEQLDQLDWPADVEG